MNRTLLFGAAAILSSATAFAQSQVSAVAVNPTDASEVWVCNRDNNSVSVITNGSLTAEIQVGSKPRSLAFTADGSTVFVTNQRGDIAVDVNFVTPFTGLETRASVSVINANTLAVTDTLTDVGTEPYGVAVAPNDDYFAVSGFRSGTIKFFDTQSPYSLLHTHQYQHSLDVITGGDDINDVDTNGDFLADCGEPRAFVITSNSQRLYVTHLIPGFVSKLDLTLNGGGQPTSSVASKVDLNEYPFHPITAPTPVQTLESQGTPRFLDDIALSPDGSTALVPAVLHNLNHDVNFAFGVGDFANRVYPALHIVDTATDAVSILHHELDDPANPATYVPFGKGASHAGSIVTLNGTGVPLIGGTVDFEMRGASIAGSSGALFFSFNGLDPIDIPLGGSSGSLYVIPDPLFLGMTNQGGGLFDVSAAVPNKPALVGFGLAFQSVLLDNVGGTFHMSNGAYAVFGATAADAYGANKMGHRAGHPSRVQYNAAGDKALMLNRGSEDVFLYDINGSGDFELVNVFPPRFKHVERAALDTSTPMGDLPLGMAIASDPSTGNNDALVYIINETTHTLSTLRVDWDSGVICEENGQVDTLSGPDEFTVSERTGQELFVDASRAQTAGNFNNSCESCHFEGGADGNVWQRPAGPRSTMPMYGGILGTGLVLWKGVRLNIGETGPMFGGENGGTGVLTDTEQQALIDYHEVLPIPINPNLDASGDYSATAALGKDLFFGTNDTGLNPTGRHAGCTECHPDADEITLAPRFYTSDVLDPLLTSTPEGFENNDQFCFSLQENIVALNIRNVNSAANVDSNPMDGTPDPDRNSDGWLDPEGYAVMNADASDDFTRDDPNGYLCPQDPIGDPNGPQKLFTRSPEQFSIPTKLGVFSTGPYFHDHAAQSLRSVVDPQTQNDASDPIYGDAGRIHLQKFFNEFHDLRGEESIVPGASKVQLNLQSIDVDADIEALLEYIRSL